MTAIHRRIHPARVALAVLAAVVIGAPACSRSTNRTEAASRSGQPTTQPGSAVDPHVTSGGHAGKSGCDGLPDAAALKRLLRQAPEAGESGGLMGGRKSWAAVVNRAGELCAVAVATDDPAAAWPGSQGIAKAKAYTANAFSTDAAPLSTARLYTMAQPGHSLWGAGAGNPIRPDCLGAPKDADDAVGKVCGGTIVFGGGVPLYRDNTRVGGLGVSGDTSCNDHEIAKRMRDELGLNPPGGAFQDDIVFTSADGPSPFAHPLCANTWRNGQKLGDEAPASGY